MGEGFEIGGSFFPWGVTLHEVRERLPGGQSVTGEYCWRVEAASVFGLATQKLEFMAPALDRPVLWLSCDLPPCPGGAAEAALIDHFDATLGAGFVRDDVSLGDYDGARRRLVWRGGDTHVGLTLMPDDVAAGLTVDWGNEIAAAAPYQPQLARADAQLARWTASAEVLATFVLECEPERFDQWRYCCRAYVPERAVEGDLLHRAQRALWRRFLLTTPADLAERLAPSEVAVWRNSAARVWGVSTRDESVVFLLGQRLVVTHHDVRAARGAGESTLVLGLLAVRDRAGSAAIAAFAELLALRGLATVETLSSVDA